MRRRVTWTTASSCVLLLGSTFWPISLLRAQAQTPSAPPDRFADIRHVKLNASGSMWIGFGGQIRERIESWTNFNFGALPPTPTAAQASDVFILTRLLVSADLHAGSHVRLFAHGKSSLSTKRELAGDRRPSDVDEIDVHQLFAEVRSSTSRANGGTVTLRGGRFEMAYGRERLVSALDWANTRRSFDGLGVGYSVKTGNVTAFWTRPVLVRLYEPDRRDSSTTLFGIHGTTQAARFGFGTDLYWIGQRRDSGAVVWNGTSGREDRHTVGVRLWSPTRGGAPSGFDLEGEAAMQFGSMGANSIRAHMLAGQAGYTFLNASRRPRIFVNVDYASGDESAGGDVQTFSQLNPQPHPFLGFADIAGRQNVVDISGGGSIRLWRAMVAAMDYHVLRRASAGDAFYALAGGIARPTSFGASKRIASELDLTLRWPVDRHALMLTGWSHVFPGDFIEQGGSASGADRSIDFAYLMLQYTL